MTTPAPAFTAPTAEVLAALPLAVTSSLVPSTADLAAIAQAWIALGVPTEAITGHALSLVNYCFDSGSSNFTTFSGNSPTATIPLSALAALVIQRTSLRKFCRYFAPLIWNARIAASKPPASWEAWNIPTEEKYAGFDFFDGVSNPAALQPQGGLIRNPTEKERIANATARSLHLFEAASQRSGLATKHLSLIHI